jgi:glycosyltransferase involved in cell wall biosynthesis
MFLGYLAQEDMPYIYSNAQFMVFPSLYEGFGIPIVEAMRSECAVACSNAGSLPEIALDCVLYFDPNSAEEIADRIEQLMDKDLRAELTAKGEQRARDFSWKISAEKLCEIMRSLVAAHEDRKKKNRPLVSIVTPSYNQGEFIEETILSVLNQTYDNIEYIVMDGGSKDNTVDILKKYSDKITWVSEKDNGQAHAVDKGIKASKGEIIGWLNSDDTFYPEAVEVMVDYFTKYKDISVIYGEGDYTKKDSSFLCKYTTYDFSRDVLESECYICQPSTFFTRKIYDKVGGIDQSLQMCMDYELWIRMAQETDFLHIQDTIATSRLYDENKTLGQRDRVYNEIIFALQRHYGRVHIKWAYGYAHYLTELKKRRKSYMYFKFLYFLIRYNIKSPGYIFEALGTVCRHAYRRFSSYSKFKGVYADSFIAADFESNILVGNPKEMIIAGSNIFFNNVGLEVMVNNNVIASITVGKGDFEKRIKLPDGLKNSEINVKLRADRSKLMIFRSRGKDMRRVSLKLTNLSFTEVGNNE